MTVLKLLNETFFTKSESVKEYAKLKIEEIEERILASYDLRSLYLHTGERFGKWIVPFANELGMNERILGEPMVDSPKLKKLLTKTTTYIGLERITRFILLRFLQTQGFDIHNDLNGPGLVKKD